MSEIRNKIRAQFRLFMGLVTASIGIWVLSIYNRSKGDLNVYVKHRLSCQAYAGRAYATLQFIEWSFFSLQKVSSVFPGGPIMHEDQDRLGISVKNRLRTTVRPQTWPVGKIVVWCLGGSTTYCGEVPDELTWPSQLQQMLGPNYEVVNGGVAGASAKAEVKLLTYLLDQGIRKPNILVVYDGVNDLYHAKREELPERAKRRKEAHDEMRQICALQGIRMVSIVQATMSTQGVWNAVEQEGLARFLQEDPQSLDARHIMPPWEEVYLDYCHVNEVGNQAIARFVYNAIQAGR